LDAVGWRYLRSAEHDRAIGRRHDRVAPRQYGFRIQMRKALRKRVQSNRMAGNALARLAPPSVDRARQMRRLRRRRARLADQSSAKGRYGALLVSEAMSPRARKAFAQRGRALALLRQASRRMNQATRCVVDALHPRS